MKKITSLIILIIVASCAPLQLIEIQPISKTFQWEDSKNDLFLKSNTWMVENFVSAKDVVQFTDKEAGLITGKYRIHKTYTTKYNVEVLQDEYFAVIKIQVKNNSSKITVTTEPFFEQKSMVKNSPKAITEQIIKDKMNDLINSYEQYIKTDNTLDFYQD